VFTYFNQLLKECLRGLILAYFVPEWEHYNYPKAIPRPPLGNHELSTGFPQGYPQGQLKLSTGYPQESHRVMHIGVSLGGAEVVRRCAYVGPL